MCSCQMINCFQKLPPHYKVFFEAGRPFLREAPYCPTCACALLPCALFFDEAYTVHGCFRWAECRQWLAAADTLVLAGTSSSVNVCRHALRVAGKRGGSEVYNFNLEPLRGAPAGVHNIIGPTEITLPALRAAVEEIIRK